MMEIEIRMGYENTQKLKIVMYCLKKKLNHRDFLQATKSYCPDLTSICEITAEYINPYGKLRKSVSAMMTISMRDDGNRDEK